MREHFFRGKAKKDGKLYYGDLIRNRTANKVFIDTCEFRADESGRPFIYGFRVEVDPETVSEYAGISDKNGKDVFEGDIFKLTDFDAGKPMYGVVKYRNTYSIYRNHNPCGFVIEWLCTNGALREDLPYWCEDYSGAEVVDNIYDNPELLEVKE